MTERNWLELQSNFLKCKIHKLNAIKINCGKCQEGQRMICANCSNQLKAKGIELE